MTLSSEICTASISAIVAITITVGNNRMLGFWVIARHYAI